MRPRSVTPAAALWHRLPDNFEHQLDTVIEAGLTEFHFDDGYDDIVTAARSLEQRGRTGVFFVTTGWIGLDGFASRAEVRGLHVNGHEIGNHTAHHVRLDHFPLSVAAQEVHEAEWALGDLLGFVPTRLAWPYGRRPDGLDHGRGIEWHEVFAPRDMTPKQIRAALRD